MRSINDTPSHPLVAASILAADFGRMLDECKDVLDKGVDLLHIDVMDGHFTPNLTMGQDMIQALRKHLPDTYLDVHLMVEQPADYVRPFAKAGANLFNFHVEACAPHNPGKAHASSLIDQIQAANMAVGVTINPPTPASLLEPYLDRIDLALVMSVHPGRSGQNFIPDVLDKAQWLKGKIRPQTRLQMDGGLNPTTSRLAVAAGVDVLVTASALFGADDRTQIVRQMHDADK